MVVSASTSMKSPSPKVPEQENVRNEGVEPKSSALVSILLTLATQVSLWWLARVTSTDLDRGLYRLAMCRVESTRHSAIFNTMIITNESSHPCRSWTGFPSASIKAKLGMAFTPSGGGLHLVWGWGPIDSRICHHKPTFLNHECINSLESIKIGGSHCLTLSTIDTYANHFPSKHLLFLFFCIIWMVTMNDKYWMILGCVWMHVVLWNFGVKCSSGHNFSPTPCLANMQVWWSEPVKS